MYLNISYSTLCFRGNLLSSSLNSTFLSKAFQNNGLAYINPHSFRHSLTRKALTLPQPIYIPLLSQNLGHKTGETIFDVYGTSPEHKRGKILKGFGWWANWRLIMGYKPSYILYNIRPKREILSTQWVCVNCKLDYLVDASTNN